MEKSQKKAQQYSEADLIRLFGLNRVADSYTPLMQEWLSGETELNEEEKKRVGKLLTKAKSRIEGWKEETLKMKFIAFILELGEMEDGDDYITYFEETISAEVEGHFLKTKTDFMLAKGILDSPEKPYFHFQEWKKLKDPSGDPAAQLIEAFLIGQTHNDNGKPLYGCTIVGKFWDFFIMEGKTYCISDSFDCTKEHELIKIIAILRKFKQILETRLLD